jgi:hypothetical protein
MSVGKADIMPWELLTTRHDRPHPTILLSIILYYFPLEKISAAMVPALTLANTPLDLQITICIFLHPSDILALRRVCHQSTLNLLVAQLKTYYCKTCKALELATRKRIVWATALRQVCHDNTLFLPSFPIPNMSDSELEWAAMAPRRWIELCGTFQKQNSNVNKMLHPRSPRIIKHAANYLELCIVPGGRYLVSVGNDLSVWDLGYVSTFDCKLIASVGLRNDFDELWVIPDSKSLVILTSFR